MIGIYYSAAFNEFFIMGIHRTIPIDAVRIDRDRFTALLAQRQSGASSAPGLAGPALVAPEHMPAAVE